MANNMHGQTHATYGRGVPWPYSMAYSIPVSRLAHRACRSAVVEWFPYCGAAALGCM